MSIKIMGVIIIYMSFFIAGHFVKRLYLQRAEYMHEILHIVNCTKSRLRNSSFSLSELLYYASNDSSEEIRGFLKGVAIRIDTESTPLETIWKQEAQNYGLTDFWGKKNLVFFSMFFSALSEPIKDTVIEKITILEDDIKTAYESALKATREKGEMYAKLVRLFGLLFSVIII